MVSTQTGGRFSFPAVRQIDASSWISWSCYALGFWLAATPEVSADLSNGGINAIILLAAVAAFFVMTSLIQRHMKLSLAASSFGHPKRLATDGIFRYSRNPIYLAFLVPLLSLAVLSPAGAGLSILVYLVAMTLFVIRAEEQVLTAKFGAEYGAYRARVPRWLWLV
ncbi:MAG: isoprenylcysteine carboxylmethyltransferase family protein [Filomicrobium sp.]